MTVSVIEVEQLSLELFDDVLIVPTIAMKRGDSYVAQCAWCGLLVCVPSRTEGTKAKPALGTCPSCIRDAGWWKQQLNTGPFRQAES